MLCLHFLLNRQFFFNNNKKKNNKQAFVGAILEVSWFCNNIKKKMLSLSFYEMPAFSLNGFLVYYVREGW